MRTGSGEPTNHALTLFSFLWATAVLFDQGKWNTWASSPAEFALSAAAYWLLFRPWSSAALGSLVTISLWTTVARLPWVSNHWMLATLVNLTILTAFARALLQGRDVRVHRAELFRGFAPAVRLQVLFFYGWAFFHKLNRDYLDPEVSCAGILYERLTEVVGLLPVTEWAVLATIFGSKAIELGIPLLMIARKTRWVGLLMAAVFHLVLGLEGFFNFSAYMFALLFLFLPEDAPSRLRELYDGSRARRWLGVRIGETTTVNVALWFTRGLFVIAVVVLLWHVRWAGRQPNFRLLLLASESGRAPISYAFQAAWVVFALFLMAIGVIVVRRSIGSWAKASAFFRPSSVVYALPILLLLLNGASPYLGLKTESSFSMFSNLRTEDRMNHLIIRERGSFVGHQEDLVEIDQSSDPEIQRLAELGYRVTFFELRSYLSRKTRLVEDPIRVRYRRANASGWIERSFEDPVWVAADVWWVRKLLYFRPVPLGEKTPCHH